MGTADCRLVGCIQLVGATPPDVTLSFEVVSVTHGKYEKLSARQRTDVWRRWKAGESLHTIERLWQVTYIHSLSVGATAAGNVKICFCDPRSP